VWYGPLVKLRPLRWNDRIKTGPSPEDGALLQLTRELAVRLDSRFWYRQIVWGRFVRGGVGWMITMPMISREIAVFWGSGVVAGNPFARGQETVACMTNTCVALVVIAAVGYWSAILGALSMVPVVACRVRQARMRKKYQV